MLFAATVTELALPHDTPHRNWKVAAGAALGLAPDLDFIFVWWLGLGREWHRGFTHSLVIGALAGAALAAARGRHRLRESVAFALALLSHDLLDALTSVRSAGVALFWPFSSERYALGVTRLFEQDATAVTLTEIADAAVRLSLLEAVAFLPLLVIAWWVKRRILTHRRMP
jgi:membrane-bound metal-dependent hydrolase YbcI (DUF457 family)